MRFALKKKMRFLTRQRSWIVLLLALDCAMPLNDPSVCRMERGGATEMEQKPKRKGSTHLKSLNVVALSLSLSLSLSFRESGERL